MTEMIWSPKDLSSIVQWNFHFIIFLKKGIISFDLETCRSSQKSRSLSKAVINKFGNTP